MDALTGGGEARRRSELESLLVLLSLPGVGPRRVRSLLSLARSAAAALADVALLRAQAGGAAGDAARDPSVRDQVRRALEMADALGMETLLLTEDGYPGALLHLSDPPPVLFLRGRTELLGVPGVAIVGSRRATARGRSAAHRLGAVVAGAGVPVVSGLALGVDGAAHEGALEAAGPTVAVLGRGADRAYPAGHGALFRRIVREGLVVSEFLPGTPALPHHFPRRNRILAGLSRALVVVEAAERSGALISVDHALDLGVEVWAVPGPLEEPFCAGSNGLLADGARPLVSVGGFLREVVGSGEVKAEVPPSGPAGVVWRALEGGGRSADEVARVTGLPAGQVLAALGALELGGKVARLPGQRFRRAG